MVLRDLELQSDLLAVWNSVRCLNLKIQKIFPFFLDDNIFHSLVELVRDRLMQVWREEEKEQFNVFADVFNFSLLMGEWGFGKLVVRVSPPG